ncbi:hypothetical protein B5F40_00705 [Gordonibacter sp. An230]|uniref:helix-turn-helix domain-containing protein n=1 Tax=Gordonibacter sp. An230 TaxID=1965592 RepID=UPI000B397082|nr:helix-turn-helix transcriptional regulator [Gordonibacter sp. An230]OUO92452.1 hypothetical protein B5F40_00705 [Gordonibacter sp. An230]
MRSGSRRFGAVVWGYALLLVFFGLFTGRVNLLFFGDGATRTFSTYAHAAEIGQVCCLFLVAAFALFHRRLAERIVPHAAFALLVCGYALTLYQAVGDAPSTALSSVAGALFGGGQGVCFLCWFMVYARLDSDDVMRGMVASTVLSGFMLLAIGLISDTVMLFSALSVVVAGSCAFAYFCLGSVATTSEGDGVLNGGADGWSKEGKALLRSWIFLERRSLLCLVAIAFVCGAQRVISLEWFLPQAAVQSLFSIGYIGGAVAFWMASKVQGGRSDLYGVYSTLLVIMATCGVLSSVQVVPVQAVLYAVDNIAFAIVSMCMIVTALKAAREFLRNPLLVGGVVCGVVYFSIQLGRTVCNAVSRYIGTDAVGILIVSVIILYVVALAAISSGLFFRQMVKSGNVMEPSGPGDAGGPEERRVIISVASVTEKELRENPVYRQQFKLTDREVDVAVLLLAGYNSADIAKILTLSVNTVKTHLKNLYAKMGVHNRRELIEVLNEIEGGADATSAGRCAKSDLRSG